MNISLMTVYHHLPPALQSWTATARGYQLRRWRYSRETDRLVEEAHARESWTVEQWRRWQDERLAKLLEQAARKVPYYRAQWSERRQRGDRSSPAYLENWPILSKESLRQHGRAFVSEDADFRRLMAEDTSGTTGTPVCFWRSRDELVQWYALMEARWRNWYGVSRHDRWGIIGGQRVVPLSRTKPPFWVWNGALRQLYFSPLHLKPDLMSCYLDAIEQHKLRYLLGYASALYWIALQALETDRRVRLDLVLSNAEPLYDYQRKTMAEAFQCRVFDTYGQGEKVAAMSECAAGHLHEWPEVGRLELLDEQHRPVADGMLGRMICTSLLTPSMPLIRYDIRDQARRVVPAGACACGRQLPRMTELLGRYDDVLVTLDGRILPLPDIIFGLHGHIREGQIIQETLNRFRIRVVPAPGWSDADAHQLRTSLQEIAGDVTVTVETVSEIERTWAGKFRMLVSHVPRSAARDTTPAAATIACRS